MYFVRPLLTLIWKNWILHRRHFIVTGFEVVLPVAVSFVMIWLATEMRGYGYRRPGITDVKETTYGPKELTIYRRWYIPRRSSILYAPNTTLFTTLMEKAFADTTMDIIGFHSEYEVTKEYKKRIDDIWGAVIFSGADEINTSSLLQYELRPSYSYQTDPPEKSYFDGVNPEIRLYDFMYSSDHHNTYLAVMASIDLSYIKLHQKERGLREQNFKLYTRRMPYPSYQTIHGSLTAVFFVPMIISCGFLIPCLIILKRIIDEKNNRAKEMMKMMGMSTPAYWGSVFISNFLIMLIISIVIMILYVIPFKPGTAVFQESSFVFFIILLLYCASTLLFCFVISTLFTKAAIAITLVTVIWVSTLVLGYLSTSVWIISFSGKVLMCLLPNMALTWTGNLISINELSSNGTAWNKFIEPPFGMNDNFCLGTVLGMMVLSCVLYTLLLLYLDSVWPWQPGIPKSPIFCFYPSYWFHSESKRKIMPRIDIIKESEYFEGEPPGLSPSVMISHLSKVFRVGNEDIAAVDDLSLNLYPGQITALLGHNGAGKTTTMNILTGICPPTQGTALINGHDIVMDTDAARRSLGLCPQHNVLYDTLTVEEHLKFFAGLKGMPCSAMGGEITSLIQDLGLQDKRHTLSKDLSGGMKRKLSLGNAVIGKSQILILDEPTTGLDPEARRVIWDMLQKLRSESTILLTTHYMEEADELGDRIAIMASGTAQCCGSPMFLKRKFGAGYHLRIEKGQNCRVDDITNMVQCHIPEAKLLNEVSLELMYSLSNTKEKFAALFQDLESSASELGIASCGVTITTMDDVFLKVGQMIEEQCKMDGDDETVTEMTHNRGTVFMPAMTKSKLILQQMEALFKKRVHYTKRHLLLLIFQILMPMIAVILFLYIDFYPMTTQTKGYALELDAMFNEKKYGICHQANTAKEVISLANYYNKTLMKESVKVLGVDPTEDPEQFLLEKGSGEGRRDSYVREYLVGGSMSYVGDVFDITAWFNGIHYHLDEISINLMTTSLLRNVSGDNEANIRVTVLPLPSNNMYSTEQPMDMGKMFNVAFLPLGLTFLSSSFVLLPIHERVSKSKLLQRMCGVNFMTYWLMHLIWDIIIYICSSILLLIPFLVYYGINGFLASEAVGAVFVCLLLYGLSSTTMSYLVSFIPKVPSSGFAILTILNTISGTLITFVMSLFALYTVSEKVKIALWFMRLFPNFAVSWGINRIYLNSKRNMECLSYSTEDLLAKCKTPNAHSYVCCTDNINEGEKYQSLPYLSWEDGAGKECFCLSVTFLLWFGIIILVEILPKMCYNFIKNARIRGKKVHREIALSLNGNEDSDVIREQQRVEDLFNRNATSEEALIVNQLKKSFGSLCAVKDLTFGVHKQECFGLLGINGAGKTTTFQMLTGDLFPTDGNAYRGLVNIQNDLEQFQMSVGYCPQFDALIDRLSGREMLHLFASLRGVPRSEIHHNVNQMISSCDLSSNIDKPTRTYSGGTKRKLSMAIALIGAPPVVLLDEPTAGVDPVSRRKIWKTLSSMKQLLGVSFILTSHSMDECEALCNRIAIMVNGKFHCLGAMQSLKAKFGQGYSIIIKLQQICSENIDKVLEIKTYIENCFPSASLKVEHQDTVHYHVTDTSVKWSKIFSVMEEAKERFQLEDYIVSGTTLEQIFLSFARTQIGLV